MAYVDQQLVMADEQTLGFAPGTVYMTSGIHLSNPGTPSQLNANELAGRMLRGPVKKYLEITIDEAVVATSTDYTLDVQIGHADDQNGTGWATLWSSGDVAEADLVVGKRWRVELSELAFTKEFLVGRLVGKLQTPSAGKVSCKLVFAAQDFPV